MMSRDTNLKRQSGNCSVQADEDTDHNDEALQSESFGFWSHHSRARGSPSVRPRIPTSDPPEGRLIYRGYSCPPEDEA